MIKAPKQIRPEPRSHIMDIAAYVPGKSATPAGVTNVHKLSSNENPLGASPYAIEAVQKLAYKMEYYPCRSSFRLRQAIATTHELNPTNILCSNGSDEVLGLLAQSYLSPGDEAVHTEYGFMVYKIYIQAAGATPVVANENDEKASVDTIIAALSPKTKIVFLANPNNPTGTYLPFEEVRRLHVALPKNVLLVLDAAYAEYVQRNDYESGIELVTANENVVMTRTFSKIHGLGGIRIGWVYAPAHIIEVLERMRDPFNVNAAAIEAGVAAMQDRSHVELTISHNVQWSEWLIKEFEKLGLRVTPSVGNFLLVHFPDEVDHSAAVADEYLTARGYILRRVAYYGFPNALRMTIGTEEANRGVIAALTEFLKN